MTDTPPESTHVPENFLELVKGALEHLYDFPFLNRHPLAKDVPTTRHRESEPAGQRLRRELIAAIETLNPGQGIGVRSTAARLYNLLHMHYVGGMTVHEAAHDLGISLRQAYRDLRRGHISIGEILWFHRQGDDEGAVTAHPPAPGAAALATDNPAVVSSVESEVERLKDHRAPADLTAILDAALRAVQKLADENGVALRARPPESPPVLNTNPVAAQQVFISLLSQAVREIAVLRAARSSQQPLPSALEIALTPSASSARAATLSLGYARPDDATVFALPEVVAQLMAALRWEAQPQPGGMVVAMRPVAATLLIVDDNAGLVALLERYFAGLAYEVISAAGGAEGLALAESARPDVVVLDLMMPGMDGWEMLQRLRTHPDPAVRGLPVVICSVIHDPALAYSLGASAFVAKPVAQEALLAALRAVGV